MRRGAIDVTLISQPTKTYVVQNERAASEQKSEGGSLFFAISEAQFNLEAKHAIDRLTV
jgi:hypothetical protein